MSIETTDEELGNKLFCDLKNDAEKANFFLSGRGYETGVIARAIQNDVAMTYHRCAVATIELRRLHALNVELLEALRLTSIDCQHLHHAAGDRHSLLEVCPVVVRINAAIKKAEAQE
jgi:hypothetical protein